MKKLINVALIVVAVIITIISWYQLPNHVIMQIGLDGKANYTLPKIIAVMIPLGISLVGSLISIIDEENTAKGMLMSVVGIIVMIFCMIIN